MLIILCATTSCGTQGETGPKGETGQQGPKGEQGEKGEKGDTYYPVVILGSDTGTIKTDVVEGKAGDSYTLTFTPNVEGQIVTSLYINYEEVELTDEILNGSYTGKFAGSVIVSAGFGTIQGYGESLIANYYNDIAKSDTQMNLLVGSSYTSTSRTGDTTKSENKEYVKDWVASDYYDDSVAKVATQYIGKVAGKLAALKKGATTKEKIDTLKAFAEEAEKKIDEKYAEVLKSAKEIAAKNISKLYSNKTIATYMSASDMTSMIAACKGEVDGATSLSGLASVILNGSVGTVGKYNNIENLRANAFESLKSAIDAVYLSDSALKPGTTKAEKETYKKFVESLEEYGIKEKQLPASVYSSYLTKISTSTSFDYYVDEDGKTNTAKSKLEYEAVEAVKDSSKNIVGTVKKAVLDSYYAEIDASTALSADASKVTAKAAVETAVSEWFQEHESNTAMPANVTNFMSTSVDDGKTAAGSGCVGYIEAKLDASFAAFQTERLGNKLKVVASDLSAYANEIIDADDLYKTVLTTSYYDATKNPNGKTEKALADELKIKETTVAALKVDNSSATGSTFTINSDSLNLKKFLAKLVTSTDGTTSDGGYIKKAGIKSVAGLTTFKQNAIAAIDKIYSQAQSAFIGAEASSSDISVSHTDFGTNAVADGGSLNVSDIFDKEDTLSEIKSKIDNANINNWVGLVDVLGYWYNYYFTNYADDVFATYGKASISETWTYIKDGVKKIQKGELTTADEVKSYAYGMLSSYAVDVEAYYKSQLSALADYKTTLVNAATGAGYSNKAQLLNNRYADWVANANEGIYAFSNRADVDFWMNLAKKDLDEVQTLVGSDTGTEAKAVNQKYNNATKLSEKVVAAYAACDNYFKVTEIQLDTNTKRLLTDTERDYVDIQDMVNTLSGRVYAALKGDSSKKPSEIMTNIDKVIVTNSDGSYTIGESGRTYVTGDKVKTALEYSEKRVDLAKDLKAAYAVALVKEKEKVEGQQTVEGETTITAEQDRARKEKVVEAALKYEYESLLRALTELDSYGFVQVQGSDLSSWLTKTSGDNPTYSGTAYEAMTGNNYAESSSDTTKVQYMYAYFAALKYDAGKTWKTYVLSYPSLSAKLWEAGYVYSESTVASSVPTTVADLYKAKVAYDAYIEKLNKLVD